MESFAMTNHPSQQTTLIGRERAGRGFTLVEILIVVVILAILAMIVVPQFSGVAGESRANTIRGNLYRMRVQIEIYKNQHNGDVPTLANIIDQLTLSSTASGVTAPIRTAGFPHGPYVRDIPVNPNVNTSNIANTAVGTSAWFYDETTGAFHANDSVATRLY